MSFTDRCVAGIEADTERIAQHLSNSLMLVTALNTHIGYDNAAKIARQAYAKGITLKEAALSSGLVSGEDFDKWVDPSKMV